MNYKVGDLVRSTVKRRVWRDGCNTRLNDDSVGALGIVTRLSKDWSVHPNPWVQWFDGEEGWGYYGRFDELEVL